MKLNVVYKVPVNKHRFRNNVIPVDIADVSNMEYYLSQAEPSVSDSTRAASDPKGPSNLGTLERAQFMFPDADEILFA